jgi:hypothetical protein
MDKLTEALSPLPTLVRFCDATRAFKLSLWLDVREPAQLVGVLHGAYTLPAGAWLLTGTSIVPPAECSVLPGDVVRIMIEGIGQLQNQVKRVMHSGAQALPRVGEHSTALKT